MEVSESSPNVTQRLGNHGAAMFCPWTRLQRKKSEMYRDTETQRRE